MRFRHMLISGLIMGAALFLPNQAFAEKKDPQGQQDGMKSSVPAESAKQEKAVNVNPQINEEVSTIKGQTKSLSESVEKKVNQQAARASSEKAAVQSGSAVLKKIPDQAKDKGQSAVKKGEAAVKASAVKKSTQVQKSTKKIVNEKWKPSKASDSPDIVSLREVDVKTQVEQTVKKVRPQEHSSHDSNPKKKNLPIGHEEIPTESGTTPPQRTSSSGGPSTDRMTGGISSLSFVDKWLEWDKYDEINRVLPFNSQLELFHHQWENAPPSPPPQKAPLS